MRRRRVPGSLPGMFVKQHLPGSIGNRVLIQPTGLSWDLPFYVFEGGHTPDGDGPRTSVDWATLRPSGTKTRYVDVNTGNDGNTGVDWDNAWKGIDYALSQANADADLVTIYVKAGTYVSTNRWNNQNVDHDLCVLASGGTVIVGDTSSVFPAFAVDPLNPPAYKGARTSVQNVTDLGQIRPEGDGTVMVPAANAAAVAATPGSWYTDGVDLWLRLYDDSAPTVDRIWISLSVSGPFMDSAGSTLYVGPETESDAWEFRMQFRCDNYAMIIFENCAFKYTRLGNGIMALNVNTAYTRNCRCAQDNLDGFNYHDTVNILEESVTSWRNGLYKGTNSNNGSSSHENARTVRVRGEHAYSYGPQIVDIENTEAWCVGVTARDSLAPGGGIDAAGFRTANNMWLRDCIAGPNNVDDLVETGAGALTVTTTEYTTTSGTIVEEAP